MGSSGAGLGRRAEADRGAAGDHRGLPVLRLGRGDRGRDGDRILAVDMLDMPMGGLEPEQLVIIHGERRVALDRDMVVIVEIDDIAQAKVTGQAGGFRADAFHHIPVAANGIDFIIKKIETRLVVPCGQVLLRDGQAYPIGEALSQRARRDLDAGREPVFRVSRCLAVQLPKVFNIIQRQVVAGQVEVAVL